ncbi:sensor domain-containing phosphodiesterase [Erwinia billingiae]|uniref:bifunctional diguanylate cyclase/phosphodiesterase n=1 Tax=Erwinia billingiae TaxID=182337 RepID=UPI0019D1FB5D|nr:sensor domain-containing phosphodiesterase [Erwinia billingiae]MBN7124782.1 sensor domain-containing phosphodiesterase [Erwinia billingiae]
MLVNLSGNEARHLDAIKLLRTPDDNRDEILQKFVMLAMQALGMPGSFISVLDDSYQYITASRNIPVRQVPRKDAFCRFVMERGETVIIPDMLTDVRSSEHPLVQGEPYVRFYAGAPLHTAEGVLLGTFCVTDTRPHPFSQHQREILEQLAGLVMAFLETWHSAGFTDPVTGLPNRQALMRELQTRATKEGCLRLTVIECIDMPGAYALARSLGMPPVESLLRDVGQLLRLRLKLPPEERLYTVATGRYAVLTGDADRSAALPLWPELQDVTALIEDGIAVDLVINVGEVTFSPSGVSGQEGLRRAVSALHEAITSGSRAQSFDARMDERRNNEFRLMHDLAAALHGGSGLYLVYQPKISLTSGRLAGLEALIRWRHPIRGTLPPDAFLPAAARTRLHAELADWVIRSVTAQLVRWQEAGCAVPVSVNLSESDFSRRDFAARLYDSLIQAGLTPGMLEIECLETEKIVEKEGAVAALSALRALGFRIALDDFGAGYSNVSYLHRMPLDVIKLDRVLVRDIITDGRSHIIATNIIRMLKELHYTVVAEGIEDRATAEALAAAGCDQAQGYYFSRPLPVSDITRLLLKTLHAD